MDELNNKQMVLLTMLVSFVVSIATGIITVAMLEEAPQTLTQTVNRVVERTIERVTQATSTQSSAPVMTTVTKEVTVYAKEEDLLVNAVEKNQPRVAVIYGGGRATGTSTEPIGIGFLMSRDGVIAVASSIFFADFPQNEIYAVSINGKQYTGRYIASSGNEINFPVTFLKISDENIHAPDPVTFSSKMDPRPGQTVVVLGGLSGDSVFKTTIAKINYGKTDATTTPKTIGSIDVIPKILENNDGALVINLDGQVIGMSIWSQELSRYIIYPIQHILELMSGELTEKTTRS